MSCLLNWEQENLSLPQPWGAMICLCWDSQHLLCPHQGLPAPQQPFLCAVRVHSQACGTQVCPLMSRPRDWCHMVTSFPWEAIGVVQPVPGVSTTYLGGAGMEDQC